MNNKITSSALAALMIAGSTSFSAFAAMANGTVVIGNKAFDLAYANNPANAAEITSAIVAGGAVYVKDFSGNWISNTTGLKVDASLIPAVVYKNVAGVETNFDVKDTDKASVDVEKAVKAYEVATIAKYNDIKVAADLKVAATTAVETVANVTDKAAFTKRIADKQAAIDATLLTKVKAVDDANATNQIDLLAALGFFNNVDANKIAAYDGALGSAYTAVPQVQLVIDMINDAAQVNAATNQIQMLAALRAGVAHGVFTNVNEDLIVQYTTTIGTTGSGVKTVAGIQADIAAANTASLTAAGIAVSNAIASVVTAEATPTASNIAVAQALVTALPADIAPATTKATLNARLAALATVAPVQAAKSLNDQILLSIALQSSSYVRVNQSLMIGYMAQIASSDVTVAMIQAKIDAANLAAATSAVATAEAAGLTAAKVATAQALVTALPADVAPATAKTDLQTRLNVVNALISIDGVVTTFAVSDAAVLNVLQANATVLGLSVNPALASSYKTAILAAGAQVTRDTASEVVAIIAGVNSLTNTNAGLAVTDAETAITAAKVATAQALVTALPADVAPATGKADLQTRLNVVNALLAVDAAVMAPGATDATVLTSLQANATVLGLTGTHAINSNLVYKTALTGTLTNRDLASEVVAIVDGVNAQAVTDATASVGLAEGTVLTAAKVATAQALVTKLPADIAPSTTKTALQTRLNVVNALLAVDAAVIAPGATDATVLASLQANATVLGLTSANNAALNINLGYKAALIAGDQTSRDTAVKVRNIVIGVNSPTAALTALKTPAATTAAELLLIKDKTLNLTNVVDANSAAYFADKTAFATAANVDVASVQKVVNAVNALVQLNAATTAMDAKTAVTEFALNTANTLYINLSTTEKLELAQMLMTDIATNGSYVDTTVLTGKITSVNSTRTTLIGVVNTAKTTGTITAMNAALASINYAPFNALDAAAKLNVAEKFLNNFPMTTGTTPAPINYTTITGIQAGIDAAM